MALGIFIPPLGIEPMPSAVEVRGLWTSTKVPVCVFLWHQAINSIQFPSDTDWASSKSTQFWRCPPGGGARSHRGRAQTAGLSPAFRQMPVTSPACHLCFWPTGYGLQSPALLSGVIDLLEGLTELRNIYQFPTEGCHSEMEGRKAQGKVCREELGALLPSLSVPPPPCTPPVHQPGCSLNPVL